MTVKDQVAYKSHQSCPTLCDPIDGSPPGSSVPEILQARILEWVAIYGVRDGAAGSLVTVLAASLPFSGHPGLLREKMCHVLKGTSH